MTAPPGRKPASVDRSDVLVIVSESKAEAAITIGLVTREVRVASRTIVLAPRESELLLALALHGAPRDRATLAAMIWPDADEARAGIVGVYINRLRRRLGNVDLIEAGPSGYALRRPVLVDLFLLEDAIRERRATEPLDPPLEALVASQHVRLPQWVLMSAWLLPYARRFESAVKHIRAARAAAAAQRDDLELMRHYRTLLEAEQHDG